MQRYCVRGARQSSPTYRLKGYEIPVYEAGTGACSGAPYNLSGLYSTLVYTPEPYAPLKTLHDWLHDLRQDGVVLTAFILGIISGKHVNFHWVALSQNHHGKRVQHPYLVVHETACHFTAQLQQVVLIHQRFTLIRLTSLPASALWPLPCSPNVQLAVWQQRKQTFRTKTLTKAMAHGSLTAAAWLTCCHASVLP